MRPVVLALVLVTACSYKADSFRYPLASFAGARTTIGCLDLAVSRKPLVEDEGGGIVVQYEFGNRCERPTTIDLQGVHAVGKTATGREVKLVAYDPDSELAPLPIDAFSAGGDAVAYRDPRGDEVVTACVDVAPIVHDATPRWACIPAAPESTGSGSDAEVDPGYKGDYVGSRNYGTRFGQWSMPMRVPQMFMEMSVQGRSVSVAESNLAGSTTTSSARVHVPAVTSSFRFGAGAHHIYGAAEVELGGVGGAADSTNGGAAFFGGGDLVAGVRGALGPVGVSAEVALGGRAVQGMQTQVGQTLVLGASEGAGVVEGRVRAELWLNPWVSVGAAVGTSMIRDEYMAGGFFSLHSRSYAGDRAP